MNKILTIIGWLGIATAFGLLILISLWSFYPYNIFQINQNYLSTNKTAYHPKETIKYDLDYCKNTNLTATIQRIFINNIVYTIPDKTGNIPTGCKIVREEILVPEVPAGTYKIQVNYIYNPNPIREIIYTIYTNEFQIME